MNEKTKKELTEWEQDVIKILKKERKIWISFRTSKSGMNRYMRIYAITKNKRNGLLSKIYLNEFIKHHLDYKVNKNHELIVNGCGMDMLFSITYNLSSYLFKNGYYLTYEDV